MQRIWATIATVWAVLGVTAALAWAQTNHVATTPTPTAATATTSAGSTAGSTAAGVSKSATVSAPAHATTHTS